MPLGGGIVTGSIQINDPANVIGSAPSANTERGLFLGDKNSVIMGGFDIMQHASDNAEADADVCKECFRCDRLNRGRNA